MLPSRSCLISTNKFSKAGGGAYWAAKRSINADKKAHHEAEMRRRRLTESLEYSAPHSKDAHHKGIDHASNPSTEASHDPAPTRHAPENEGQRVKEKSKYEASEPYRSRKGDRFS